MKKQAAFLLSYLLLILTICLLVLSSPEAAAQFANQQLRHHRVAGAENAHGSFVRRDLESRDLPYPPTGVFLRAFKKEGVLEAWVKDWGGNYVKFKEFTVCASAGRPGPKRRQGDRQVPEGFYYINRFNPTSKYHLSLGINYPNASDRMLGYGGNLGGDIYIHGDCKTAGCLPLTDDKMEELYWLCVLAKDNGQSRIPIHIFPYRFKNWEFDDQERGDYPHLAKFWNNLKEGYELFEYSKIVPQPSVGPTGLYQY